MKKSLIVAVSIFAALPALAKEPRDQIRVDDLGIGTELEVSHLLVIPAGQSVIPLYPKRKYGGDLGTFTCHADVHPVSWAHNLLDGRKAKIVSADVNITGGVGTMTLHVADSVINDIQCNFVPATPDRTYSVAELKAILDGSFKIKDIRSTKEAFVDWAKQYTPVISNLYKNMTDDQFRAASITDAYRKDYDTVLGLENEDAAARVHDVKSVGLPDGASTQSDSAN